MQLREFAERSLLVRCRCAKTVGDRDHWKLLQCRIQALLHFCKNADMLKGVLLLCVASSFIDGMQSVGRKI